MKAEERLESVGDAYSKTTETSAYTDDLVGTVFTIAREAIALLRAVWVGYIIQHDDFCETRRNEPTRYPLAHTGECSCRLHSWEAQARKFLDGET